MKKITLFTILLFTIFSCSSISPSNLNYFSKKTGGNVQNTREQMDGIASWYGPNFQKTAKEIYAKNELEKEKTEKAKKFVSYNIPAVEH